MNQLEFKQVLIIERGIFKKELVEDASIEASRLTSSGLSSGKLQERPEIMIMFDSEYSKDRMMNFDDISNIVGARYGALFYKMSDDELELLTDDDYEWMKKTYT